MQAVIDRIEGSYAVLLIGEKEVKLNLPVELLPSGAKEGSWLRITFDLAAEETQKKKHCIEEKLEKLKKKHK